MDVIVIDDDEDLRTATLLALEYAGLSATGFGDCDTAMRAIDVASRPPGVVLLDVNLDVGMSARDFTTWLRARGLGHIPVLLVTGDTRAESEVQTIGAVGLLRKPFELSELTARVRLLLQENALRHR